MSIVGSIFLISFGNNVRATGFTNFVFLTSSSLQSVSSNNCLIVEAFNLTVSVGKSSNLKAYKVDAIDSNGAGDIFAGGCLHAIISGEDFHESCNFGNYASSQIVQERSPRLTQDRYIKLKENYLEL